MRLTSKQQRELTVIKYFVPGWVKFDPITDENIETFFAWSDRGKEYNLEIIKGQPVLNGLSALHYGKQWREVSIKTWRDDIEDGIITKGEILHDMPDDVALYIEKALKGAMLGRPEFEEGKIKYAKPEVVALRTRMIKSTQKEDDDDA